MDEATKLLRELVEAMANERYYVGDRTVKAVVAARVYLYRTEQAEPPREPTVATDGSGYGYGLRIWPRPLKQARRAETRDRRGDYVMDGARELLRDWLKQVDRWAPSELKLIDRTRAYLSRPEQAVPPREPTPEEVMRIAHEFCTDGFD